MTKIFIIYIKSLLFAIPLSDYLNIQNALLEYNKYFVSYFITIFIYNLTYIITEQITIK